MLFKNREEEYIVITFASLPPHREVPQSFIGRLGSESYWCQAPKSPQRPRAWGDQRLVMVCNPSWLLLEISLKSQRLLGDLPAALNI